MASPLKLNSNITESVCRTCLKINKSRFNIFEHSHNNKFVSELLMECTPLKVQKNDGFPVNICIICLDKLKSVLEFKEMAVLSFTTWHNFYQAKSAENSSKGSNPSDIPVKEELDSKSSNLLSELLENPVYKCVADLAIPDKENMLNTNNSQENIKERHTSPNAKENSLLEEKLSASAISKDENYCSESAKDDYNSEDTDHNDSIKCDDTDHNDSIKCDDTDHNDSIKCDDTDHNDSIKCDDAGKEQTNLKNDGCRKAGKSNIKNKSSLKYESIDNSVNDSTFSNQCSSDSENDEDTSTKRALLYTDDRKDKNTFNWIEKHIDILNNPDCKKIINMGLSKKEKDRATVVCEECGKTVNFRYYVQVHAQTHIGNMPYKCERCGKSFPQRHILNQHIRAVHEKTIKLSCDVCGKGFASPSILLQHKAKHSDEKPFKCETCGKTFKLSGTLKKHYVVHNKKEKQYMCELCGKSFLESNNLREHILSHTTEKNFNCTICEKAFTTKRGLDCHIKRHSGNRPYVCSYCGKSFTVGSVLKKHILIHTGAKPYTCKVCDRKFTQDSSLRYHMRIHTGEKPYSCKMCCVDFRYKHLWKNHMNKLHKGNAVTQDSKS